MVTGELIVEAGLDCDSRNRPVPTSKVGLPVVLACIRGAVEWGRIGVPDFNQVPVADYGGLSGPCCWRTGLPGESSARILAFRPWLNRSHGSAGW